MKNKETKIREEKETPIMDGDTRPDAQENAADAANSSPMANKKKKKDLTKERAADVNSLEDYKDAK